MNTDNKNSEWIIDKKKASIKNWAKEDRPREKVLESGTSALSDAELLAIVIGSGNRHLSALDLAKQILLSVNNNLGELCRKTPKQITSYFKGIGEAKAVSILASVELGKRHFFSHDKRNLRIASSQDAFHAFYTDMVDANYEIFQVLLLSSSNQIIKKINISEGGVASTIVDPKKIFKFALEHHSSSIILGHNHPSGNIEPSPEDMGITKRIKDGGKLLDIKLIDHIIVAGNRYYSFAENDKI